ncbi:MAG: DUF273 domain-containing protein [Chlamydiota bacterium]
MILQGFKLFFAGFSLCVFSIFAKSLYGEPYTPLEHGIWVQKNHLENATGKKIAIATVIISDTGKDKAEHNHSPPYAEVVDFGTQSKELYAKKHGYDFFVATQKLDTSFGIKAKVDLAPAWSKLALVAKILENYDYDWVFLSDADSLILNLSMKLETLIAEDFDVILCTEQPIDGLASPFSADKIYLNSGQILYKNCPFSKQLLKSAWQKYPNNQPGFWDQKALISTLLEMPPEESKRVLVQPSRAFNLDPYYYRPGDFLVHMWGYHGENLIQVFDQFEQDYKRMFIQEAGFPIETSDFLAQTMPLSSCRKQAALKKEQPILSNSEQAYKKFYYAGISQENSWKTTQALTSFFHAHACLPYRAEPLFHLAVIYRKNKNYLLGYLLAKYALSFSKPAQDPFLDSAIYDYRLLVEFANCALLLGKNEEGLEACVKLLSSTLLPEQFKDQVVFNKDLAENRLNQSCQTHKDMNQNSDHSAK